MVAGVLSLEEDAKRRGDNRVKTEKSKGVEEAMAVQLKKRTPVKVVEKVLYIDKDMRGLMLFLKLSLFLEKDEFNVVF